jgi:hypothetical protein
MLSFAKAKTRHAAEKAKREKKISKHEMFFMKHGCNPA